MLLLGSNGSAATADFDGSTGALSNGALHAVVNTSSDSARIGQALSEDTLSQVDNDTVMDDSELLEFDFDSKIQPLGANQQASIARDIKMLQTRLYEATRLSLTMPDDSNLASNAGSLKRQLIMAKENYQLLFGDVTEPLLAAVFSTANKLVPSDTPYIYGKTINLMVRSIPTLQSDACFSQF